MNSTATARYLQSPPRDVLIVDDEPDARLILRLILQHIVHVPVREARDGVEALELVQEHLPRLIILDLTMPRMDGVTFLEKLRSDPNRADIPVLLFTAHFLTPDQAEELQVHPNMVFQKGRLEVEELQSIFQSFLKS
jgi:CheY-like chemotaxis protein